MKPMGTAVSILVMSCSLAFAQTAGSSGGASGSGSASGAGSSTPPGSTTPAPGRSTGPSPAVPNALTPQSNDPGTIGRGPSQTPEDLTRQYNKQDLTRPGANNSQDLTRGGTQVAPAVPNLAVPESR